MMAVQRVFLFAVVCVVFAAEFNADSAELSNYRRLAALEKLVRDDSPMVRLEALRALAKIPSAKSAELALTVLDKPMDPFLDYALWLTINDLADQWIAAVKSGEWKVEGNQLIISIAASATLIEMSVSADARRLMIAAANGVLGRAIKLQIVPGANAGSAPQKSTASFSNGSSRARAEDEPVVRRMKEKFGAEIRTVIDYRKNK